MGWRENCPARNSTCNDCKKTGHFSGMHACRMKKVSCIKFEKLHSIRDSNTVMLKALGTESDVDVLVEADTGANLTVFSAQTMEDMSGLNLDLEHTDMHVKGFDSSKTRCRAMAKVRLQLGREVHEEMVYFSDHTESNFLSIGACKALRIIHSGFPTQQVNSLKKNGNNNSKSYTGKKLVDSKGGQNPLGTARSVDKTPYAKKMDRFQCKKGHVILS